MILAVSRRGSRWWWGSSLSAIFSLPLPSPWCSPLVCGDPSGTRPAPALQSHLSLDKQAAIRSQLESVTLLSSWFLLYHAITPNSQSLKNVGVESAVTRTRVWSTQLEAYCTPTAWSTLSSTCTSTRTSEPRCRRRCRRRCRCAAGVAVPWQKQVGQ